MKKIINVLMISAVLLCATACSSGTDYEETETVTSSVVESEILETEPPTQTPDNSSEKSVDKVIELYNSKLKEFYSKDANPADVETMLMSYDRKETVSQKNVVSYEYSTSSNAVGMCLFEDIDTKEIKFGNIELNKAVITQKNQANILQGFMQMCYFLTYAIEDTTEDEFMEIWRTMQSNSDYIAVYSDITYQIQDYDDYLMFAFDYKD